MGRKNLRRVPELPYDFRVFACFSCNRPYPLEGKLPRTEECPGCGGDLHVCRNCRFYSPSAHNQCLETESEWVRNKEKANFCDFFEPADREKSGDKRDAEAEARRKLDDLFK